MDIKIDKDLKEAIDKMKASRNISNSSATTMGASSIARHLWPGGVVPYVFYRIGKCSVKNIL